MTYHTRIMQHADMAPVLALSPREGFIETLIEKLGPDQVSEISDTALPASLGGRPVTVLVDADPELPDLSDYISSLRDTCGDAATIIAMVPAHSAFDFARRLKKAGAHDVLPDDLSAEDLREQIAQVAESSAPVAAARAVTAIPGHVIAVTQARGGIGSTTVAVNLACGLVGKPGKFSKKGPAKRVALVDFDLQFGNANVFFDLEDNGGLLRIIDARQAPDAHQVRSIMQSHKSGVDVLCAPDRFVPLQSVSPDTIEALLSVLQDEYDYVVVDLPRAMVDWIEPVLKAASMLMLVTDTSVPCIRQAQRIINFFHEDNVGLPVQVAVSREKKAMFKPEHVREAERILDRPFANWLPDNTAASRKAVDYGSPVLLTQAKTDLAKAMRKLADSVEAAMLAPTSKKNA